MPISSYAVIPEVIHHVEKTSHKRVLDLGIGNGMYGCLVRNYWKDTEIIGIEGFDGYRNYMWAAYNNILIGTMPDVLDRVEGKFDAIIICDVIEHFEKEEGLKVIEKLKTLLADNGRLIVSSPSLFVKQGAYAGNELERHRSLWNESDLREFKALMSEHPDKFGHYMQVYLFKN